MQDFDELKKLKAQCIADIREALPLYANRLNSIDERLMTYIEDAISNEGSHSNLYENLGIRKELRLMDSYDLDPERVKRSLRAIEGQWANGRHVKGGPNNRNGGSSFVLILARKRLKMCNKVHVLS